MGHTLASYWDERFKRRIVKLLPGEYHVVKGREMLITILGSCVSACIRDKKSGIGGMNHFLLPHVNDYDCNRVDRGDNTDSEYTRYGDVAMRLLINELLRCGSEKEDLEAKIFGGGRINDTSVDVGNENVAFAKKYLNDEGIGIVAEDVGGDVIRKLYYIAETNEVYMSKTAANKTQY